MTHVGRRLCLSFLVGLYLLVTIVTPAQAIIPAGFYAGTIIRGIIAGAGTRAAIPAAGNAAKALSASGLFGVSAAAYIVMCGQNYVSGNDCSGTPLAKLRPQNQTGNDGETAAGPIAATQQSAPAGFVWATGTQFGTCSGPSSGNRATADAAAAAAPQWYLDAAANQSWAGTCGQAGYYGVYQGTACQAPSGNSASCPIKAMQNNGIDRGTVYITVYKTTGCPVGTTVSGSNCISYTCPSGYTLTGTTCTPTGTTWTADGVPSYRNQAGVWVADPLDPDTAAPLASPIVETTTAPDGQPMKVEITANPDGSIRMRTFTQGSVSGQTTTSVNDITISASGTPTATTNIFYGDVNTVYNQTAPTVQTPAPQIELPTDYQRDATGQQTNTKLQTIIDDGLKVKEQGVPASEGLDAGKTAYQDAAKAREDALPNITSPTGKQTSWAWNLALPTGCSPLNVDMRVGTIGRIITLDPCAYQATIHELVSMCWAATTLFLVFGMVGRTLREV